MAKKKSTSVNRSPEDSPDYDGATPLSAPEREFFCILFTTNTLPYFWGHGQHSYAFAFGHDRRIEEIHDKIDHLNLKTKKGKEEALNLRKQIISIERSCRASAPRLLASVSIKLRCGYLIDQLASHTIVDRELLYTIQQRDNLEIKIRAIEHHDKRVGRIKEKSEITHVFEPIDGINYVTPVASKGKK